MKKKGVWFLLALIVIVAWWWLLQGRADAAPEVGVFGMWSTRGYEADRWSAAFDGVSLPDASPIEVRTSVRSDELREAPRGNAELVRAYHEQGLVETLSRWTEAAAKNPDWSWAWHLMRPA